MPVLHTAPIGPAVPRRGNALTRFTGRAFLRGLGWHVEGSVPDLPRFIFIGAPHTSNWDFFIGVAAMFAMGFRASWLGKHTLFEGPFGWYMRWLGGIPVRRGSKEGVVEQAVEELRHQERLLLALSPEGTRKKVAGWKSGFYFIAKGAGVPIIPVSFDYSCKTLTILPPLFPSEDTRGDWERLDAIFSPQMAKFPELYTPPGPPPDNG